MILRSSIFCDVDPSTAAMRLRMSCGGRVSSKACFKSDILNSTSCLGKLFSINIFEMNFSSSSKYSGSLIRIARRMSESPTEITCDG